MLVRIFLDTVQGKMALYVKGCVCDILGNTNAINGHRHAGASKI